jgi:predicted HicB family RNase H-like nuclease
MVRWVRTTRVREGDMGRKKVTPKMKTEERVDIRLRVDGELHERIQAAADQDGNAVAAFIRYAVVKELKRREREANE